MNKFIKVGKVNIRLGDIEELVGIDDNSLYNSFQGVQINYDDGGSVVLGTPGFSRKKRTLLLATLSELFSHTKDLPNYFTVGIRVIERIGAEDKIKLIIKEIV